MNDWILLLGAALAGSVVSLLGGVYLLYGKKGAKQLQRYAVPFAAGALLAAAFVDLLPEALEHGEGRQVSLTILVAFLLFFFLERGLSWFHHHHEHDTKTTGRARRNSSLIIIGDTLHNFMDGLAIGAAFLVDPAIGIVTTLAIAAHEVPQEIGDFGLLLSKGMKKKHVLLVNIASALVTVVSAALVYGFGGSLHLPEALLLAGIAGFFIYIAASDIIPTIHHEPSRKHANIQSIVLLVGVVFVGVTTTLAHNMFEHSSETGHHHGHIHADDHDHDDAAKDHHDHTH